MSKLAPRPWSTKEFDIGAVMIFDANEKVVATVGDLAIAELLVKRVNMCDELVREIESVLENFRPKECSCDGEYVDGRIVGHACYFHRNEDALRQSLAKAEAE